MNFDLVYREIGNLGRYQKYILVLSGYTSFYAGLLFISSFFTLSIPKHRCAIPGLANDTYAIQNELHQHLINLTIPPAEANDDGDIYDKCNLYNVDMRGYDSQGGSDYSTIIANRSITTCNRWVYDESVFTATLAAELNMVCDRAVMKSNGQMVFFGGLLTGSLLTGMISDRFGRKMTLCVSSILYLGSALGIAWTPSYAVYLVLIFAVGFFSVGNFMPAFVMGMEFTGPSKRRFAGQLGGFFWTFGNLVLAGLGYAIRDWTKLQLACAAPGVIFMLYWIIYPESPRWLYTQGRLEESEKIITKAAKVNQAQLPEKFFDKVFRSEQDPVPVGRVWHLFSSKTLAIRTSILYFNWIVVCMAYYGLALNSGDLGGDLFMNFFLQSFMDIPANVIIILLLDRIGRKPLQVGSMIIGGAALMSTIFTIIYGGNELQWLTTTFAMIGKIGASAGFSMVYQYSAELFPTVVRNAGMGSSSCIARVGGMIAPYIADLIIRRLMVKDPFLVIREFMRWDRLIGGDFGKALPLIIFGSLSIVAGLLALLLPETLNKHLPETIEDGEKFGTAEYMQGRTDSFSVNRAFEGDEERPKVQITDICRHDNSKTMAENGGVVNGGFVNGELVHKDSLKHTALPVITFDSKNGESTRF